MLKIEQTILKNLFRSEEFIKKVYPFLKEEYFVENDERELFKQCKKFIDEYGQNPTEEAVIIQVDSDRSVNESLANSVLELLDTIKKDEEVTPYQWLYNETEKFCKTRAIYIGITEAIEIADGNTKKDKGSIPEILQNALSVCFDTKVGMEFFDETRYEMYKEKDDKVPFISKCLNHITKGGVSKRTMNLVMAPPKVRKIRFFNINSVRLFETWL